MSTVGMNVSLESRDTCFRREALAVLLGMAGSAWGAAAPATPLRLAISESMVTDVNVNDARVAMLIWIKQMMVDLNVVIEFNSKVFDTTEEIMSRARGGRLDAVALNIFEYRQIADILDSSQVVAEGGSAGQEQYLLLAKRNGGFEQLKNLKGRRLCMLKGPKMCVAGSWLSNLLDERRLGVTEQFFGSIVNETKVSRVVLPVFFGQSDACVTSKRGFATMCELNPQVGKDLIVTANSEPMVVQFYVFRKNYSGPNRDKFIKVLAGLRSSAAGRQLATLFQFDQLSISDAHCLTSALTVINAADRNRERRSGIGHKG